MVPRSWLAEGYPQLGAGMASLPGPPLESTWSTPCWRLGGDAAHAASDIVFATRPLARGAHYAYSRACFEMLLSSLSVVYFLVRSIYFLSLKIMLLESRSI